MISIFHSPLPLVITITSLVILILFLCLQLIVGCRMLPQLACPDNSSIQKAEVTAPTAVSIAWGRPSAALPARSADSAWRKGGTRDEQSSYSHIRNASMGRRGGHRRGLGVRRRTGSRRELCRSTGVRQPERRARHPDDRQGEADPDHLVHAAAQSHAINPTGWVYEVCKRPASGLTCPSGIRHGFPLWRRAPRPAARRHAESPLRQPAAEGRSEQAQSRHRSGPGQSVPQPDQHPHARPAHAGAGSDRRRSDLRRFRLRHDLQLGQRRAGAADDAPAWADRDGYGRLQDPRSEQPSVGPALVPSARARHRAQSGGARPVGPPHRRQRRRQCQRRRGQCARFRTPTSGTCCSRRSRSWRPARSTSTAVRSRSSTARC